MIWRRPPIVLTLVLALATMASACTSGDSSPTSTDAPITTMSERGEVEFVTEDGLTLEGRLFGTGEVGVVLAHMRSADQTSWFLFAERLAKEGYRALTFNFRGYGGSDGPQTFSKIDLDTRAAVTYLRNSGARMIVSIGASMGGTSALATASDLGVDAVVTLSAPDVFEGIDALTAAASLGVPAVFAAGELDARYGDIANEFAVAAPGEQQTLVFLGESAHGTDLFEEQGEVLTIVILGLLHSVTARGDDPAQALLERSEPLEIAG